MKRLFSFLFALFLSLSVAVAADANPIRLRVAPSQAPSNPSEPTLEKPIAIPLALPGEAGFQLFAPDPAKWVTMDALEVCFLVPPDAPKNLQMLVQVADWDNAWFQSLRHEFLKPGETNTVRVAVDSEAKEWEPVGHPGAWHRRSMMFPLMVRVRLFANEAAFEGELKVFSAEGIPSTDAAPPVIRNVRPTEESKAETPVDGRFELRFEVSDRYANPFDPDEIAVDAEIKTESGTVLSVPCFYYQDCLRQPVATYERILPQGRPEWRLRFSPNEEGVHTISLKAKDRFGETRLENVATITATPAEGLRRVHISKRDGRYFEDDAGKPFFLIGYNIRSPHDTRMDENFPTSFRHPEGTTSYARRFRQMAENGLNIAEIWASAWCMGLEWSPTMPGYHGIGQFNLLHAWERDRVYAMAAESGMYINQVLNNHGRLSSFCDPEWDDNPYNAGTQPGGWYHDPMQWFFEDRARVQYEKQLRYEIARYSWNANLFAWELWSELDLAGKGPDAPHDHPIVHAWHKRMAQYLKDHDPKKHLVSTHTSTDYSRMVPGLAAVAELDHICGDAYHGSHDTLHICDLMHATKAQEHLQKRTALITEFGGTPEGASITHLRSEVHAALWDALPSGLAGAPMFWWWHVVEEFDFFSLYKAYSNYLEGEDFLDPELKPSESPMIPILPPEAKEEKQSQNPARRPVFLRLAQSPTRGYGWIHVANFLYRTMDPAGEPVHDGYRLKIPVSTPKAVYTFEFWDTLKGEPVRLQDIRERDGFVEVPIPAFARDIAFKFHLKKDSNE